MPLLSISRSRWLLVLLSLLFGVSLSHAQLGASAEIIPQVARLADEVSVSDIRLDALFASPEKAPVRYRAAELGSLVEIDNFPGKPGGKAYKVFGTDEPLFFLLDSESNLSLVNLEANTIELDPIARLSKRFYAHPSRLRHLIFDDFTIESGRVRLMSRPKSLALLYVKGESSDGEVIASRIIVLRPRAPALPATVDSNSAPPANVHRSSRRRRIQRWVRRNSVRPAISRSVRAHPLLSRSGRRFRFTICSLIDGAERSDDAHLTRGEADDVLSAFLRDWDLSRQGLYRVESLLGPAGTSLLYANSDASRIFELTGAELRERWPTPANSGSAVRLFGRRDISSSLGTLPVKVSRSGRALVIESTSSDAPAFRIVVSATEANAE